MISCCGNYITLSAAQAAELAERVLRAVAPAMELAHQQQVELHRADGVEVERLIAEHGRRWYVRLLRLAPMTETYARCQVWKRREEHGGRYVSAAPWEAQLAAARLLALSRLGAPVSITAEEAELYGRYQAAPQAAP